ncbi:DUF1566 domain-containing protein [Candidatus Dojkabacteria bacterium]|nr:DUF1566 domain-containing protein [Candidatus Dojkabacteria bacterium]
MKKEHKITFIISAAVATILLTTLLTYLLVKNLKKEETDKPPVTNTERPLTTKNNISATSYPVVDTNQQYCYNKSSQIPCPDKNESFYGQDAQYSENTPSYTDNGNGTITDNVTGLMWQQDPGEKVYYSEAVSGADSLNLGGHTDWRLPTIKELYSLMDFSGDDLDANSTDTSNAKPFINTDYFKFKYGNPADGDRVIDSQWATSNVYESTVMNNQECFFGVNFADGRIKCYPTGNIKKYFVIYVRGASYGVNECESTSANTITDNATGLMWTKDDNSEGIIWEDALNYCSNLSLDGYNDWRLPDAKELQSIVDYSRSPDSTNSAAIDPIFDISTIKNELGNNDYPFFWSSTTHTNSGIGSRAAYIAFGESPGRMNGNWMDVHGAGAQRSDPKAGNPDNFSSGKGPQGDAIRIYNFVRCVRSGI